MAVYTVVPDGLTAYGVEAIGANRFQSIRGFVTAEAARAWIARQKAADLEITKTVSSRPAMKMLLRPIHLSSRNRDLLLRAEKGSWR